MSIPAIFALYIIPSLICFFLAGLVFFRNPHKNSHRAFALLAVLLGLWTIGVMSIVLCRTEPEARFWLRATFILATFIPASFYMFLGFCPRQRFEGYRSVLAILYALALALSCLSFTRWYLLSVTFFENRPLEPVYGPVFNVFGISILITVLFALPMLLRKLRTSVGIERRQVEHVALGIFLFALLATLTNIVAPLFDIDSVEALGPLFILPMMAMFAYAMVRYQLLDVRLIVSRTTVYAIMTAIIALIFLGAVWLVQLVVSSGGPAGRLAPTLLAALTTALVLHPLKERVQLFLDRTLVKRRYDTSRLIARVSGKAARTVHLHELLHNVAADIQAVIGVPLVRVLLVDERDQIRLLCEYSTIGGEATREYQGLDDLLSFARSHPKPLALEPMLRARPNRIQSRIAALLAELDAYLCVPLKSSSGLVGLMALGQKESRDVYTREDLVVFTAIAGPLATAIENARLYRRVEEISLHQARILSNMRGGVLSVDVDGKVSTVNKGIADILGAIRLGAPVESLPPPLPQILKLTLRERRAIQDFETTVDRPDGQVVPVAVSSSCLSTSDGAITGAMVMVYDLSQVKRLEQNVQRADRLSSIGTLAAGMAHEIKNPLVSIKTFTQLLPERYQDEEFRSTFLDIVPSEVERIDTIVARLLDFARPKPIQFAPQNLRRLIDEVLALAENQARKRNIDVVCELGPSEFEVYGDEQQLHQVFLNLVLNAIDALEVPGGGTLRVSAELATMRTEARGAREMIEVPCVNVTVADTGCGIPESEIENLFNPFYTTKERGCGLGLAVVHGIVTEHGGGIDVVSAPGTGTSFIVSLPLAQDPSPVGEKP